jgi:hypothetical protein
MRDYLLALCCAAAIFAGVVACFLPGARRPAPAAPYCDEVLPVAVATDAKPKATCSPACKATEVCIDGVCCQPAVSHSPGSSNAVAFAADSLR